jgi:hypothetical protein
MVNLLIDHKANVNLQNNRSTPLFLSVIYGQKFQSNKIVEILVNNNADLNFVGVNGLTPFILACMVNNSPAAKFFYESGADPSIRDNSGNDFFYYVLRGNDSSLIPYFVSKGFEIPRMSSVDDGPYIRMEENGELETYHMYYDSLTDRADWFHEGWREEARGIPDSEAIKFLSKKNHLKYKDEYMNHADIFVVSDIHGHYDNFVNLLKTNKIIDSNLEWAFGKGHLVIVGDVFDRGNMVTECLWLIFTLEYQAKRSGGMVHYLLGNHEIMILKDNNEFYANDKYILPYAKVGINYHNLFNRNYVLGQWLRSKNIVVKINNLLFVHGGIPPDFVDMNRTLTQINQSIHDYMTDTSEVILVGINPIIQPTWYRGYFRNADMSNDLSRLCKYYKVDKIIVGHTTVDQVKLLQNNFVIGVGIHFNGPERPAQGLLIHDGEFYHCDEKGNTLPL